MVLVNFNNPALGTVVFDHLSFLHRSKVWIMALWTYFYTSWYLSWSHIAQAQVLGTLEEILGGREPAEPAVVFWAGAEALRFPQGVGGHPHDPALCGSTQCIPNGKKEAAVLLWCVLLNGLSRGNGLFCLLVFKKEIHVVNVLL